MKLIYKIGEGYKIDDNQQIRRYVVVNWDNNVILYQSDDIKQARKHCKNLGCNKDKSPVCFVFDTILRGVCYNPVFK